MAIAVWRFESNVPVGDTDPDVTVFIGESYTNDATGDQALSHDISNPVTVKLSELAAFLAAPVAPPEQMPHNGAFIPVGVKP